MSKWCNVRDCNETIPENAAILLCDKHKYLLEMSWPEMRAKGIRFKVE
jgi:hypothetical protein